MSTSGLTQRRKAKEEDPSPAADGNIDTNTDAFQGENYSDNSQDLTLMEEIVLLGLKDSEVFSILCRC